MAIHKNGIGFRAVQTVRGLLFKSREDARNNNLPNYSGFTKAASPSGHGVGSNYHVRYLSPQVSTRREAGTLDSQLKRAISGKTNTYETAHQPIVVSNLPWARSTKFGSRPGPHGARPVVNNALDIQKQNEAKALELVQMEHPNCLIEDVSEDYEQLGHDIEAYDEKTDELIATYDSKSGKYISKPAYDASINLLEEDGVFTQLLLKKNRMVVTQDMPKQVAAYRL